MRQITPDLCIFVGDIFFILIVLIGIPLFAIIIELLSRLEDKILIPKKPTNPRQIANLKILLILTETAKKHPDQRFGQILINTNTIDQQENLFYEESVKMLERIGKNNLL